MRLKPFKAAEGVMEMIRTVLDNSNFVLGEKNYIKTSGVAIGSRLCKNFACIYMRKWDETLFTAPIQPAFYKRFVDDGFGVWTGTETELKEFAVFANTIHENIKVQLRYHKRQIEFLDTLVMIENGPYLHRSLHQIDRQTTLFKQFIESLTEYKERVSIWSWSQDSQNM